MTDPILTPEVYGPDHANANGLAAVKAAMDAIPKVKPEWYGAKYHAGVIADECVAAMWRSEMHDADVSGHRRRVIDHLTRIADLFGFDLVERDAKEEAE